MKTTTRYTFDGPMRFAIPVGSPSLGTMGSPVATTRLPDSQEHEGHSGRWYAVVFLSAAALVLVAMGVWQFTSTQTAPQQVTVAAAPAQYAGISVPQAMRLSDTVVSGVPAQYAGISVPQAMRLSDTVVSGVPAQYAGISVPQAMRLSDVTG
jgi:hypothetical protein